MKIEAGHLEILMVMAGLENLAIYILERVGQIRNGHLGRALLQACRLKSIGTVHLHLQLCMCHAVTR